MKKRSKALSNLPIAIILLIFAMLCVLPFWLVLSGSLTSEAEIMSSGFGLFPKKIDFTAYKILMTNMSRILNGYKISLIVTVVGTTLTVFRWYGSLVHCMP